MWALVKEGVIEKIYYSPKSMVLDNVRYPSNMFTLYTKEEKKRINIYDIKRKEQPDHNFYNVGSSSFTWNASEEMVDEDFTVTEKDLSKLKTDTKQGIDNNAYTKIEPFSWLVQRYVYDHTQAIPKDVVQYAASVRTFCDTICTAIDNCNTLNEFKTVYSEIFTDGEKYNIWPDNTDIEQYMRIQ
jgi:hypothetical protein